MTQTFKLIFIVFLSAFSAALFPGCASFFKSSPVTGFTPETSLKRVSPDAYPRFGDDLFYDGLEQSILQSLLYFKRLPKDRSFRFGQDTYDTGHMIRSSETFLSFIKSRPSGDDLNRFIRDNYQVYRSTGEPENGDVLFTGYYEPKLSGSLTKSPEYPYPVFAIPDDLLIIDLNKFSKKDAFKKRIIGRNTGRHTVVPYYTRKEIGDGSVLDGQSEIIAYVKDRIDLFFLEIQGSGIIYLDNGTTMRVHYHTSNGRPYKSIGNYLIGSGKIPAESISAQKIKQYLHDHPDEIDTVLNQNPSYVFFKKETAGPLGCYNVDVTPGRSIATDKRLFPPCAVAFIMTKKPLINGDGTIEEWTDLSRFVMNQDTGGAIVGPGRVDVFHGNGRYAEIAAGHMNNTGSLYFLVLKRQPSHP